MDEFRRHQGRLYAEECDLGTLGERFGTPTYVYSRGRLLDHLRRLRAAWSAVPVGIRYAVEANGNLALLRILAREGAGFDVVSGGGIERVLRAGVAWPDPGR